MEQRVGAKSLLLAYDFHPSIARLLAELADEMIEKEANKLAAAQLRKFGIDTPSLRNFIAPVIDKSTLLVLADTSSAILLYLPSGERDAWGRWLLGP